MDVQHLASLGSISTGKAGFPVRVLSDAAKRHKEALPFSMLCLRPGEHHVSVPLHVPVSRGETEEAGQMAVNLCTQTRGVFPCAIVNPLCKYRRSACMTKAVLGIQVSFVLSLSCCSLPPNRRPFLCLGYAENFGHKSLYGK